MPLLNTINNIASDLGLNEWDIQDASYNGFQFATISKDALSYISGANLGIVSTIASGYEQLSDTLKLQVGQQQNEITKIPVGSYAGVLGIQDMPKRNLIKRNLPHGGTNIRDLGYNGEIISFICIFSGNSYQSAVSNIRAMYYSDQEIQVNDVNYHVLIHPLYKAPITGCWIDNFELLSQPNMKKTAIARFTFYTEQPIGVNIGIKSPLDELLQLIDTVLDTTNILYNTWNAIKAEVTNGFYLGSIQTLYNDIISFTNNIQGTAKQATNNLAPAGFNSISLNNNTVSANNNVFIFEYITEHYTPQDITNAIETITAQGKAIIILLQTSILPATLNIQTSINLINACINLFTQYLIDLLNNFYNTTFYYQLPRAMDINQVMILNNLDINVYLENVLALNQGLNQYLANLPKDFKILLPKE